MYTEQAVTTYCPVCNPEIDPTRDIAEVWHCDVHRDDQRGSEDSTIIARTETPSGAAEAGGDGNRAFCDFIHRKKVRETS